MPKETIQLAAFAVPLLNEIKCRFCDSKFSAEDVTAQGNRRGFDGQSYYFFESICPQCGHPAMSLVKSRPMSTKGLWMTLGELFLEAPQANDDPPRVDEDAGPGEDGKPIEGEEVPPAPKRTGISDAEMKEALRILRGGVTHEDVLLMFGVTKEQMDAWDAQFKDEDDAGK